MIGLAFPNIDPVAFHISFFAIRWYSLAYIFGIFGSWFLLRKMSIFTKSAFTVLKIDDFLIWGMLGIILGGRLGYVLFYNLPYYKEYPMEIFALWNGGMSFHGGLIGFVISTLLFCFLKKLNPLKVGDMFACVAPLGLLFGRLANFANGELFGRKTNVPWAIRFPMGGYLPRHPSQLYEAFGEGLFLFLLLSFLWWRFDKLREKKGFFVGLFFTLYGLIRFGIEYVREPDEQIGFLFHSFTMGQLLCLPMILIGLSFIFYAFISSKKEPSHA